MVFGNSFYSCMDSIVMYLVGQSHKLYLAFIMLPAGYGINSLNLQAACMHGICNYGQGLHA